MCKCLAGINKNRHFNGRSTLTSDPMQDDEPYTNDSASRMSKVFAISEKSPSALGIIADKLVLDNAIAYK